MINTAEVMLWGTRIGIIHMNEANGVVAFEYDKDLSINGKCPYFRILIKNKRIQNRNINKK